MAASIEDDQSVASISGTSMSVPMVAGVLAMYMQRDPAATPQNLEEKIKVWI